MRAARLAACGRSPFLPGTCRSERYGHPALLANFRHSLHCVARQLVGLLLQQASLPGKTAKRILDGVAASRPTNGGIAQPVRPQAKPETRPFRPCLVALPSDL